MRVVSPGSFWVQYTTVRVRVMSGYQRWRESIFKFCKLLYVPGYTRTKVDGNTGVEDNEKRSETRWV